MPPPPIPTLCDARPFRGATELIYDVGGRRAAVRVDGERVVFPRSDCELGASLGDEVDEAVRQAARSDLARARLAGLLRRRR